MHNDDELWRLSPADRLELVALDLELRRTSRALIQSVWHGFDPALHNAAASRPAPLR